MPLIRNGCLKVTVSRRDLVKKTFPELARAQCDSMKIEPPSRAFASHCCNSSVRSVGTQPWIRRLGRTGITVRLLSPNSHDFLSNRRPRPSALDWICRIIETRRRRMAACDQAVDQGLVLGRKTIVERAQIVVPLFLGAGTGYHARDKGGVQHPRYRELAGGDAFGLGMPADLLRQLQRFRPPLGLHHALVVAPGTRLLVGRRVEAVF